MVSKYGLATLVASVMLRLSEAAPVTSTSSSSSAVADTKYLISFGDSYSQTWFNISGEKPSTKNSIGNPPFPGWTAAGGPNWVGSIVTEFNTTLTLAYNFAYGGATVDSKLVTLYKEGILSFVDQVEQFSGSIASKPNYAPWTAENALAAVWMGVNDVGNSFYLGGQEERLTKVLARYFDRLQVLYDAGLRNFALLTVPPTNLTPTMMKQQPDSLKLLISSISQFNNLIAKNLKNFITINADVSVKVIDTSVAFNMAVNDPKSFGAPDATCFNNNGVSCLWFDDYHPGIAIERLVAAQVAKAWDGFFKCRGSMICKD